VNSVEQKDELLIDGTVYVPLQAAGKAIGAKAK